MYVSKKEAKKLLLKRHGELFDALDQKRETLFRIFEDDDWSFVIKMHAFIEAMVTELLLTQIDDDRIRPTIERLPLSDEQAGKLKMAKDLDLLDASERKFIKMFSSLRNNLAHRIENTDFTFAEYIESLDKNQRKAWAETISWYAKDDTKSYYQENALKHPKMVILLGIYIMSGLKTVIEMELKGLREINEMANETAKKLLADF
ncbi:hypothetical protein HYO27_22635 [Vibrio parahaemolyticus]|uniref:hypothetical protein n=1 Tax=Vibrio parahaemolyticus TaxID=670 RepID=UPI0011225825|nr:hypothetical protein [Vibrio parahaemolyticus]MBM4973557.1 hypothetical protein [Vibrio parahaemolyticus]TOZ82397.1 hypothetical protein DXJ95_24155 [Vibrio parahaemolyticus]